MFRKYMETFGNKKRAERADQIVALSSSQYFLSKIENETENDKVDKMETKNEPNEPNKFICEKCEYVCSKISNFKRHLSTRCHIEETFGNKKRANEPATLKCLNCEKCFSSRGGLWKHKKKCVSEKIVNTEMITTLIKQNAEIVITQNNNMEKFAEQMTDKMTSMILELCKNGIVNTTNSHNNNNNSQFNLNFFLNETCKNAMNLTDFVDSIKLQVSDLERIGEEGFVEGMSNIIISNLNNLDETIRPIHCTDKKRETIYIKDENVWSKDENQMKMRNTIKKLANKNIRMLPQYREKYPEHKNSYSKQSDIYDKLIIEVMSTSLVNEDKIIKKITNATTIKRRV